MNTGKILYQSTVIISFILLSACCQNEDYAEDHPLLAELNRNLTGQGVAAWEQPGGDGLALARFGSTGSLANTSRIGSGDNPITVTEISKPAAGLNGDFFVLWRGDSGNGGRLRLNRYVAATATWNEIGLPTGTTSNPALAYKALIDADDGGNAWLLWVVASTGSTAGQIWVAHYSATVSDWDMVFQLDNGINTGKSATISVNAQGNAIVAWSSANGNEVWVRSLVSGVWLPQIIVANSLSGQTDFLSLALDNTGNGLLAWQQKISNNLSEVHAVDLNGGSGSWSADTRLDIDSFARGKVPTVSMRGTTGHIVWLEGTSIWTTNLAAGSGSYAMQTSLTGSSNSFRLDTATDGRAYLGWYDEPSQTIQMRTFLPMATSWSSIATVPVVAGSTNTVLAASTDEAGNLRLLWEQTDDRNHPDPSSCNMFYRQVWYGYYDVNLGSWTGTALQDTKRVE